MGRTRPTTTSTSTSTQSMNQTMARASATVRGKRSGVLIENKRAAGENGLEDMDAMFGAARTPTAGDKQNEDDEEDADQQDAANKRGTKQKKKKQMVQESPRQVRMSLPGVVDQDDEEEEEASVKSSKNLFQVVASVGKNVSWSPSDMSRVSTAPPTPKESEEDEHEEDLLSTQPEQEESFLALSSPPTPQKEEEEVAQSSVASPDAFPVTEQDDDDDDLLPPNPPEDDFMDMGDNSQESPEQSLPTADTPQDALNNDEDDHDDDDKEGSGFNMVHDPETPMTVREDRVREEKGKLEKERAEFEKQKEKERKKGKRGRPKKSHDESSEEEGTTPVRPQKANKKKNKTGFVFSPQGYATGPRDYEAVPVSDMIEPSPDDKNVRRSKRARCLPLKYWKNEKQVFGAHEEGGVLGKAMGDMPVVTNVMKALPTPHKKRAVRIQISGTKKKGKGATYSSDEVVAGPEEVKPFDSRKIRKRYKVIDGESAPLWDDGADDSADLSKYSITALSGSHFALILVPTKSSHTCTLPLLSFRGCFVCGQYGG
jgi:centromere protein C